MQRNGRTGVFKNTRKLAFIAISVAVVILTGLALCRLGMASENEPIEPLQQVVGSGKNESLCHKALFDLRYLVSDETPKQRSSYSKRWSFIISNFLGNEDYSSKDKDFFTKIDFSFPGDTSYGDGPEWEFFNPDGKFKATMIPQEVIDNLTTVKNTRPIFNVIKWRYERPSTDDYYIPDHDRIYLVVIIPNFIPSCVDGNWREGDFRDINHAFSKDNHGLVEAQESPFGFVEDKAGKKYLVKILASRAANDN